MEIIIIIIIIIIIVIIIIIIINFFLVEERWRGSFNQSAKFQAFFTSNYRVPPPDKLTSWSPWSHDNIKGWRSCHRKETNVWNYQIQQQKTVETVRPSPNDFKRYLPEEWIHILQELSLFQNLCNYYWWMNTHCCDHQPHWNTQCHFQWKVILADRFLMLCKPGKPARTH